MWDGAAVRSSRSSGSSNSSVASSELESKGCVQVRHQANESSVHVIVDGLVQAQARQLACTADPWLGFTLRHRNTAEHQQNKSKSQALPK